MTRQAIALLLLLLVTVTAIPGCAGTPTQAQAGTIQMTVTEGGYEPDHIKVKKGQLVKLVVTRKTDATCAKELVIDEPKVHVKLPLNHAVTVTFTPTKSGELKYGCAMDKMVYGIIVVE
jgi:plastocyanin domain-containing protein